MPFSIEPAGPQRLRAAGELDYGTAAAALQAGLALIETGPRWTIDLSGITSGDSAGVAVLVEWLSAAAARNATLAFESVPLQMLAIARISELDVLLLSQPESAGSDSASGASGSGSSVASGSSSGSSSIDSGTLPS